MMKKHNRNKRPASGRSSALENTEENVVGYDINKVKDFEDDSMHDDDEEDKTQNKS